MNLLARTAHAAIFDLPAPRQSREGRARTVRALLVDDNPDILHLMRVTFSFHDDIDVCAEGSDAPEALYQWRAAEPDVIVMDLQMPVMSGLEAAQQILAAEPKQQIVLYSASFTAADLEQAEAMGVARCCEKRELDCLPDVVRRLGARARPDLGG